MWHKHPIVVIDFETTGVDAATCMPVEVAAARFEDGVCVRRSSLLCNPGIPIPEGASAVHKIFDANVANEPPPTVAIAAVMSGMLQWRRASEEVSYGAWLTAYNAPFDSVIFERFMGVESSQKGRWLDPLVWVRAVDKSVRGAGRHKLTAACERRGVALEAGEAAHRAQADAVLTGKLLWSADIFKRLGERTMVEVLDEQSRLAKQQNDEFAAYLARSGKT
jgi:DNA polymerase-3 subunit epsilon